MTRRPPKPPSREDRIPLWRYARLFRQDILSAQPERLYSAWMAEFRTPFFRSYLANDPELVDLVLKTRPEDFPKSSRISEGLRPLLGQSVFLTNGETWKRQRRIIDPAFDGGRLRDSFGPMWDAAAAFAVRVQAHEGKTMDAEVEASHAAADVIFRSLFSIPIEAEIAQKVYSAFRRYQRSQPILNLGAFLPLPRWMPRGFRRVTRDSARDIRNLIAELTEARRQQIDAGAAPADLATKIMTTTDPQTGDRFDVSETTDQVAIFFLAGHETSAASLAWALYLLALYPEWQDRVAEEAQNMSQDFAQLAHLKVTRDVYRETLRLYPPVPMMVREAADQEYFRKRTLPRGAQVVLSPWHLHRHTRFWDDPDQFDPARWQRPEGRQSARQAYMPFSAGPRVCPGAGFAMMEGVLMLAHALKTQRVELTGDAPPVPIAHLTVRSKNGIRLRVVRR